MSFAQQTLADLETVCARPFGGRRRFQRAAYRSVLLLADALAIELAFAAGYWLRFDLQIALHPEIVPPVRLYIATALLVLPAWLLVLALFGLYDLSNLLGGTREYSRVASACSVGTILLVCATFLQPNFVLSRAWLISSWLLSITLICLGRFLLRRIAYRLRRLGWFVVRTVILGSVEEVNELVAKLKRSSETGFELIGFLSKAPYRAEETTSALPLLGSLEDIVTVLREHGVEELIVSTSGIDRNDLLMLFEVAAAFPEIEIRFSAGLFDLMTAGLTVSTVGDVALMHIRPLRLSTFELLLKRLLDLTAGLFAMVLVGFLAIPLAILIKKDSPGPVFYRRRVLGVGGYEFDAIKFRTMRVDADALILSNPGFLEEWKSTRKLQQDPRVTKVGRWLRRYSLDELPQLINVLIGQMSLVGPRMITREELAHYGPLYRNLLSVKPGLTGLWQVSGRSDLTYQERVRMDMYYVKNYSIWKDLQILFVQTLPAVIKGRGAR